MNHKMVTHRMPPMLHARLAEKARREQVSINEMYTLLLQAFADGRLFVCRGGAFPQAIGGIGPVADSSSLAPIPSKHPQASQLNVLLAHRKNGCCSKNQNLDKSSCNDSARLVG